MAKNTSARSSRDTAREAHAKKLAAEKRRSRTITWTIVGVIAAVVAIVVVVSMMSSSRSIPDAGAAPTAGTVSGGLLFTDGQPGQGDAPAQVDATTVAEPNPETAGQQATEVPGTEAADIIIYADANCVYCAQFETDNTDALNDLLAAGHSLEYRMVNFLDNPGTGNYSSRAANAMACVAEEAPEQAADFIHSVFTSYNTHQGAGISNDELVTLASDMGADINSCVSDNTFRPFVNYTTAKAIEAGIAGTPSVWVNGVQYENTASSEPFGSWAAEQLGN